MLLLFDNSASYLTPESLTAGSIQFMNLYNYDYMRLSLLIYVVTLTAVWCTGVGFAAYEERNLEVLVTEVVFIFYITARFIGRCYFEHKSIPDVTFVAGS